VTLIAAGVTDSALYVNTVTTTEVN